MGGMRSMELECSLVTPLAVPFKAAAGLHAAVNPYMSKWA